MKRQISTMTAMGLTPVGDYPGRIKWRTEMMRKYERAARYPWLPVTPDPPEPE